MPVTLRGKLPDDERNGTLVLADEMASSTPGTLYLGIVLLSCPDFSVSKETGERTARLRIHHIEIVTGPDDVRTGQMLMRRADEDRHGGVNPRLALEVELEAVFTKIQDELDGQAGGQEDPPDE